MMNDSAQPLCGGGLQYESQFDRAPHFESRTVRVGVSRLGYSPLLVKGSGIPTIETAGKKSVEIVENTKY